MIQIIILPLWLLLQFCSGEEFSKDVTWRAYVNHEGNKNCTKYIPDYILEAMRKSSGTIPFKYLYKCLLDDYIKDLSPLEGEDKIFNISSAITVNEILEIFPAGAIQVSAQIYLKWHDHRLKWDSNEKVGNWSWPSRLLIPANRLWLPVPEVFNCDEDCAINIPNNTLSYIFSNGSNSLIYKSKAKATCNIRLDYFPFDKQTCEFYIGLMNVEKYKWILDNEFMWSYYMEDHNEWLFSGFKLRNNDFSYYMIEQNESSPAHQWFRSKFPWNNIEVMNVTITAVRSTSYYMTNLIIPLLILNVVAIASVAFPSGSGDRPNTLLTVILAYTFFQSVLASVLPRTREDSFIGSYLMWAMVSAAAQLLVSFVLVALNDKETDGDVPPLLIRKIVIRFPKRTMELLIRCLCCCKKHDKCNKESTQIKSSKMLSPTNKDMEMVANDENENKTKELILSPEGEAAEAIVTVSGPTNEGMVSCPINEGVENSGEQEENKSCSHEKLSVPHDEGWDHVADALNWFIGAIFVALNVLIFLKYMQPLMTTRVSNLFERNYFSDIFE